MGSIPLTAEVNIRSPIRTAPGAGSCGDADRLELNLLAWRQRIDVDLAGRPLLLVGEGG
jgi:hypothetical protein